MSANYAAGLSHYENKGKCGLPEFEESWEVLEVKIKQLAEIIRNSKHLVVHTGAGVSTDAGIPDFRGPDGVWTLEKQGRTPLCCASFGEARPTFTHMALCALENGRHLKYLVTQNVDGLHLRSGFPRDRLAELHGNMFIELCQNCRKETIRDSAVPTVGLKLTGNVCKKLKPTGAPCRGKLKDVVLDWEHQLPEKDLIMADHHSKLADVSLCLGTTLQIVPAGNLPLACKKNGGKIVIINLQETKHHKKADLVIHAKLDPVMRRLMQLLEIPVKTYESPEICETSRNGPPQIPSILQRSRKPKGRKRSKDQKRPPSASEPGMSEPKTLQFIKEEIGLETKNSGFFTKAAYVEEKCAHGKDGTSVCSKQTTLSSGEQKARTTPTDQTTDSYHLNNHSEVALVDSDTLNFSQEQ